MAKRNPLAELAVMLCLSGAAAAVVSVSSGSTARGAAAPARAAIAARPKAAKAPTLKAYSLPAAQRQQTPPPEAPKPGTETIVRAAPRAKTQPARPLAVVTAKPLKAQAAVKKPRAKSEERGTTPAKAGLATVKTKPVLARANAGTTSTKDQTQVRQASAKAFPAKPPAAQPAPVASDAKPAPTKAPAAQGSPAAAARPRSIEIMVQAPPTLPERQPQAAARGAPRLNARVDPRIGELLARRGVTRVTRSQGADERVRSILAARGR